MQVGVKNMQLPEKYKHNLIRSTCIQYIYYCQKPDSNVPLSKLILPAYVLPVELKELYGDSLSLPSNENRINKDQHSLDKTTKSESFVIHCDN